MKTKIVLPVLTVIAALAIVFGASSFKEKNREGKKQTEKLTRYYFQYLPTTFSEANYETTSSWSYVGTSPGASDPCPGSNVKPCVIHADLTTGANAPSDLVAFLNMQPSATAYAESDDNISYKKPNAE